MRQILQDIRKGQTILAEVPSPMASKGFVLISTRRGLVSAGTEKMLLDFGKAGWIEKAWQQPEKVAQVLAKVKTDGLATTVHAVRAKLDQPIPMGYSNVGVVLDSGEHPYISKGDRVISNGPHAEIVRVPHNLCAKIPQNVTDEQAAFTVVGAIGLQGIRLLNPTLGENVVVTGLGLIGLICVQLLRAQGCRVLGIDFNSDRCKLAREFGAETVDLSKGEDPVAAGQSFSRGRGVDGVLIAASTKSNDPVRQGAMMCRKRGKIVLVGVTGLELSRADFYEKELSFQVSCSYGPGRYDPEYEEKGRDYPVGFVRWTEQRNFEAFLDVLSAGQVNVDPIITHRIDFENALDAYQVVNENAGLGIVLQYPVSEENKHTATGQLIELKEHKSAAVNQVVLGLIGSGSYSGQVLIPALAQTTARLKGIVSEKGVTGTHHGMRNGFEYSSTRIDDVLEDEDINLIVISTRHDSHSDLLCRALRAGKNVFVEKPLCLNEEELHNIIELNKDSSIKGTVTVGFNRRFAPQVEKMCDLLAGALEPKAMVMTVNAGHIPTDHWTQDPEIGGGRIIGEACHFIDLLRFLAEASIKTVSCVFLDQAKKDTVSIQLSFEDGSIGTINYFSNGNKSIPKERLEVFCAGRVLQLDNFRRLTGHGWKGFSKMNLWRQDKGHAAEMNALIGAITNGELSPTPFDEIVEVTRASFVASGVISEM